MTHQQLAELRTLWGTRVGELRPSGESAAERCAAQHLQPKFGISCSLPRSPCAPGIGTLRTA